jgi:hypothetical protein
MSSTVQLLEDAGVKLSRLNAEEAKAFQLDNCLGGSSEVHPRKSIERYLNVAIPQRCIYNFQSQVTTV